MCCVKGVVLTWVTKAMPRYNGDEVVCVGLSCHWLCYILKLVSCSQSALQSIFFTDGLAWKCIKVLGRK